MIVELRLLGGLKDLDVPGRTFKDGRVLVEADDGMELSNFIVFSGLETAGFGFVLVNGRHAGPGTVLAQGDIIAVFPRVGDTIARRDVER